MFACWTLPTATSDSALTFQQLVSLASVLAVSESELVGKDVKVSILIFKENFKIGTLLLGPSQCSALVVRGNYVKDTMIGELV